jgi:hypothetical protein
VLVPRLRADAVVGYETATGDRDVTLPTVRRIPLHSEGKKSEITSAFALGIPEGLPLEQACPRVFNTALILPTVASRRPMLDALSEELLRWRKGAR